MPSNSRPSSDLQTRANRIVRALARLYPVAECALRHRNPFELLVATILSAQCTDARVNQVTPLLFDRFPDSRALARAERAEVEAIIHSTGFFRAKAKNLVAMAQQVVERHEGEIPSDLKALTALPGVGRKTANVVLGTAFVVASGVVVDTHVKRLAFRLGLTEGKDPVGVETDLIRLVPKKHWIDLSHRLILHGRRVCGALRPNCEECRLATLCPKNGVTAVGARRKAANPPGQEENRSP